MEFVAEDGADYGGLTRELFRLFFENCRGILVHGPEDNLCFVHNKYRTQNGEFKALGRAIGLSVLHGCGVPFRFGLSTVEGLLGLPISELFSIVGLPDADLKQELETLLQNANSLNLQELMRNVTGRFEAGFPDWKIEATAEEFVRGMISHHVYDSCTKEIEEVAGGVKDTGLLALLQRFPTEAKTFLRRKTDFSAAEFSSCVQVSKWSDDDVIKAREEDIVYEFKQMLQEVGRKGFIKIEVYLPAEKDQPPPPPIEQAVDLKCILAVITGADRITPDIERDSIKILFNHSTTYPDDMSTDPPTVNREAFVANTCAKTTTFPITDRYCKQLTDTFITDLVCSPGFHRV